MANSADKTSSLTLANLSEKSKPWIPLSRVATGIAALGGGVAALVGLTYKITTDIREAFEALGNEFKLEISKLKQEVTNNNKSLDGKLDGVKNTLNEKIDNLRESLSQKIDQSEEKLNKKIDQVEERLNKKIDQVEERLNKKIDLNQTNIEANFSKTKNQIDKHGESILILRDTILGIPQSSSLSAKSFLFKKPSLEENEKIVLTKKIIKEFIDKLNEDEMKKIFGSFSDDLKPSS